MKLIDSLRSNLAKNAIVTLIEMCKHLSGVLYPNLESIILRLMKRGSDTNTLIAEESKKALNEICHTFDESKVVEILLGCYSIKTSSAKINICRCLQAIALNTEERFKQVKDYDRFLILVASYILDGSQETRNIARVALTSIIDRVISMQELEKILRHAQLPNASIEQILSVIKKDHSNPDSASLLSSNMTRCNFFF